MLFNPPIDNTLSIGYVLIVLIGYVLIVLGREDQVDNLRNLGDEGKDL